MRVLSALFLWIPGVKHQHQDYNQHGCLRDMPGHHSRFEQFEPGTAVRLALDGL
jgi:hypothetical protein